MRLRRTFTAATTVVVGALGVALLVKGVLDGLWPLSAQPMFGLLFIIYAIVRWRALS